MCWQVCIRHAKGSFGMRMCALLLICVLSADRLACTMPNEASVCACAYFRSYAYYLPTGSHAPCQLQFRHAHGRASAHTRTICQQVHMRYAKDSFGTRMGVLSLICTLSAYKLACIMQLQFRRAHGRAFAHMRTICRQARMLHANCSFGTHMYTPINITILRIISRQSHHKIFPHACAAAVNVV